MAVNDVIGAIDFIAPDEGTGTDAILLAGSVRVISEGDFSASNNAAKMSFMLGLSGAASEVASISSAGLLTTTTLSAGTITETSARELYDDKFFYTKIKIQKTLPTQGYHVWHIEHGKGYFMEPRAFVYTIYLNDVEAGGETEFLHQSVRVKPVTGRIVIWPAGFPYVHRGNPPLSGEKYILTSWMLVRG